MRLISENEPALASVSPEENNSLKAFFVALLTLLSGVGGAQIIPYLATILLAHLFAPTAFASLAFFSSITSAAAIVITGRYELAILLPKRKIDSDSLVLVTFITSFLLCLLFGGVLLLANHFFEFSTHIWGQWYLLPFATLSIACYQTMMNWFLRYGYYGYMTFVRFIQAGSTALISIALGWYGYQMGLVLGYFCGWILASVCFIVLMVYLNQFEFTAAKKRMMRNVIQYSSHAVYGALPALLDNLSFFCIMFIIYHHYGSESVGQYNLSKQIFYGPISLIVGVVGQIVFRESSQQLMKQNSDHTLFTKLSRYLLFAAILYTLLLILVVPSVVSIFLGSTWHMAGKITTVLAISYAIRLAVTPLSYFLLTHHAMSVNGIWQISYFIGINLLYFFHPNHSIYFWVVLASFDVCLYGLYYMLIRKTVYKSLKSSLYLES